MQHNDVWDLVDLLNDFIPIGYKWVYNTKRDSRLTLKNSKLAWLLKASLRVKENFIKTYSPVFGKNSFRINLLLTSI